MLFFGGLILGIRLIYYIFYMFGAYRVFQKCGVAGWKAFIPVYNLYVQYGLTWQSFMAIVYLVVTFLYAWLSGADSTMLVALGTVCNLASSLILLVGNIKLSKSFGHGVPFGLGLYFLQPVFIMILGFGADTYIGNTTEA